MSNRACHVRCWILDASRSRSFDSLRSLRMTTLRRKGLPRPPHFVRGPRNDGVILTQEPYNIFNELLREFCLDRMRGFLQAVCYSVWYFGFKKVRFRLRHDTVLSA